VNRHRMMWPRWWCVDPISKKKKFTPKISVALPQTKH
jgi:hypothetical protein